MKMYDFYFMNEDVQKFTIEENNPINTFVGKVKFSKHFEDEYVYSFGEKSPLFLIDSKTGDIVTAIVIDVEKLCPLFCPEKEFASVPLSVSIHKDKLLISMIKILVTVLDMDDNIPEFEKSNIVIEIKEMIYKKNALINLPLAKDRDIMLKNREMNYKISGDCSAFILEESRYQGPKLRLLVDIDYETQKDYRFMLSAYHKLDDSITANLTVHIKVININDCPPQFASNLYEVSVNESVPVEERIIQVIASDQDGDSIIYSMLQQNNHFQIRSNGDVYVMRSLDYESQRSYSFVIQASDGEFVAETNLRILILDVNDESPMYTLNPAKLVIDETNKSGILVGQITIYDRDSISVNRGLKCVEPSYKFQALRFAADSTSNENMLVYKLYTMNTLDRESIPKGVVYTYLICYDSGINRQLSRNITIPLYVHDVNDNAPYFANSLYQIGVKENNAVGYRLYQMLALDSDVGINGKITYALQSSIDSDTFQIDAQSGWIKLMQSIDRESKSLYTVIVLAYDHAGIGRKSGSATLIVNVLDENDNIPQLIDTYDFSVKENQPIGFYIGTLKAYDKDEAENARVIFHINVKSHVRPFTLNENGSLYSNQVFDREKMNKVCTQLQLSDSSPTNVLTSQNAVCVTILDENDNYPQISLYENDKITEIKSTQNNSLDRHFNIDFILQMSVREQPGFIVAIVKATDEDVNNNSQLSYYIENIAAERELQSVFDINIRSGSIVLNRPLHRDFIGTQRWKILVEDSGKPPLKSGKNILIKILDIPPFHSRSETSKNKAVPSPPLIGNNLLIAVILSIVSAMLILLLISAIICIVKPCNNRTRFRNQSYQSNFVPSLMFLDQSRHLSPDLTEKPKFEISGQMDGLWGGNMMKPQDLRMMNDPNWKNSAIISTHNEYMLENYQKTSQINDYNVNPNPFPIYSVPGSLRLLLRNDEQRSDSGKGASDDDMSYVPRFVNEPSTINRNDVTGPLTYNSTNTVQLVQFPTCMFNCSSPINVPRKPPMQADKLESTYPPMPTYSSTNI